MVETVYTLFLYLILVKEEDFNHTFFFCSDALPELVRCKLPHHHCFKLPKRRWHRWLFRIWLYYTAPLRFPFIKQSHIYGSDNYLFSSGIARSYDLILVEDGLSNYSLIQVTSLLYKPRRILMGQIAAEGCGGVSPTVKKIMLTGLLPVPALIQDKTEIFSVINKWNRLSSSYRTRILSLFDCLAEELEEISSYQDILFTQPMVEDGLITLEDELNLYRTLLAGCNQSKLLIKVHPRDTLDYSKFFPEAKVWRSLVPMELISLLGIQFQEVYTVFSTAALSLPYKTHIHFMGTSVHSNLLRMRGLIEYSDSE